jgi:hypothetical protein
MDSAPVFSLENYIKRLLFADDGRYRFVVLVITDQVFSTSDDVMTGQQASALSRQGAMMLSAEQSKTSYDSQFHTTALIYEFRKTKAPDVELVLPSPLPGHDHLERSRIWAALEGLSKTR